MFIGVDCAMQGTNALILDEQWAVHGRARAFGNLIERDSGSALSDPAGRRRRRRPSPPRRR